MMVRDDIAVCSKFVATLGKGNGKGRGVCPIFMGEEGRQWLH